MHFASGQLAVCLTCVSLHRALKAGMQRPLLVCPPHKDYPNSATVAALGALHALYMVRRTLKWGDTKPLPTLWSTTSGHFSWKWMWSAGVGSPINTFQSTWYTPWWQWRLWWRFLIGNRTWMLVWFCSKEKKTILWKSVVKLKALSLSFQDHDIPCVT